MKKYSVGEVLSVIERQVEGLREKYCSDECRKIAR